MLGKFGADDARVGEPRVDGDSRSTALFLMSEALACLDSDNNIPAHIGAHLQSAIDALWISASKDQHSIHLH